MSFLAPLFLLGAGLVALPIWLHLRRETTDATRAVASLMFFREAREPVAARLRVQSVGLLALRIGLILALCASFAKPVLDRAFSGGLVGERTHHLIAVDTSLSMRCCDRFAEAARRVAEIRGAADPGDVFQVFALGAADVGASLDAGEVEAAFARLAPGVLRVEYGSAVRDLSGKAAELLERLRPKWPQDRVVLHLVSDFQASAAPLRFADLVPAEAVRLELHAVGRATDANWWIDRASFSPALDRRVRVTARVRGSGTPERERTVGLFIGSQRVAETRVRVPAAGAAMIAFAPVELPAGETRLRLELDAADSLVDDDRTYVSATSIERQRLRVVTSGPSGPARVFLETAARAAIASGAPIALQDLAPERPLDARDTDVAVFIDTRPNERLAGEVAAFVASGGGVLRILGAEPRGALAEAFAYGRRGALEEPVRVVPVAPHPVLRDTVGWSAVQVFAYAAIPEPGRVVLRAESGDALLRERPDGTLLLGIPLDPAASDLALQPLFVPFLVNAVEVLGAGPERVRRAYTVGMPLVLGDGPVQVFGPSGQPTLGLAGMGGARGRARSLVLEELGFYEWTRGEETLLLAVNPDSRESDVEPLSDDALARWRAALAAGAAAAPGPAPPGASAGRQVEEAVEPQPLWVPILVVLVLFCVAEGALANRPLSARPESTT